MVEYELLDTKKHSDFCFKPPKDFLFAKSESILPIGLSELPLLMKDLPVAFAKGVDKKFQLVVLLSLIPGENEFIDDNGKWRSSYTPAVLRCHPFRTVSLKDKQGNFSDKGKVLAFVKNSPYITSKVDDEFIKIFEKDGSLTENAVKLQQLLFILDKELAEVSQRINRLFELNVLSEISITDKDGNKKRLENMYSANKKRLAECSIEHLKSFVEDSTMELMYYQSYSLMNFKNILKSGASPDISTRETVLRVNREKKAAEINTLVQDLLIDND